MKEWSSTKDCRMHLVNNLHDGHDIIMLCAHSIVERRVSELIFCCWVCLEMHQILNDVGAPLRCGNM